MTALTPDHRELAAKALWEAERTRETIPPLTVDHPEIDVVDAYQIQLINIRRRLAEGRLIRGHKVGLSSKAMQEMMGVDEPDYGHLLDDMFVFEDEVVPTPRSCANLASRWRWGSSWGRPCRHPAAMSPTS